MSKDKLRLQRKKLRQQERQNKMVQFQCGLCGAEEDIPLSVVRHFDLVDDGDITEPPRFSCEKCGGEMHPLHYVGVHGINYGDGKDAR